MNVMPVGIGSRVHHVFRIMEWRMTSPPKVYTPSPCHLQGAVYDETGTGPMSVVYIGVAQS